MFCTEVYTWREGRRNDRSGHGGVPDTVCSGLSVLSDSVFHAPVCCCCSLNTADTTSRPWGLHTPFLSAALFHRHPPGPLPPLQPSCERAEPSQWGVPGIILLTLSSRTPTFCSPGKKWDLFSRLREAWGFGPLCHPFYKNSSNV